MKFIYKAFFSALLGLLLFSCKKEEKNPLPGWDDGVTGFGVMESGTFKANNLDNSPVVVSISYNDFGKGIKVDKIQAYVHSVETYYDSTKQQEVSVEHFGPTGKTDPALVINNPEPRKQYSLTITPEKVYNLFKDATYKYNGPSAVNVFQNPEINRSDAKKRFRIGDRFYVTWYIYASDGRVFKSWSVSIQNGEVQNANTQVSWKVVP